jgi:hypothetical protein
MPPEAVSNAPKITIVKTHQGILAAVGLADCIMWLISISPHGPKLKVPGNDVI